MYCIYKITNDVNNKIYIGCTHDALGRWNKHRKHGLETSGGSCPQLYSAMRKHGIEHFTFDIIHADIETQEEMYRLEKHYIQVYNSFTEGYNATLGGSGGDVSYVDGWLESVREYHTQRPKHLYATRGMQGKKHSEETKKKQSDARKKFWERCNREKIANKHMGIHNSMYGRVPKNAVEVILNGVKYSSYTAAAKATGHSARYVKKHGVLCNGTTPMV